MPKIEAGGRWLRGRPSGMRSRRQAQHCLRPDGLHQELKQGWPFGNHLLSHFRVLEVPTAQGQGIDF